MLIVEDFLELNALVAALWTLKFDTSPMDSSGVAGSRYVAKVYTRAYEALITASRRELRENIATELERLRAAEANPLVLNAVQAQIRNTLSWRNWETDQKRDYVSILLSPYCGSEHLIDSLLEAGDAFHSGLPEDA